MTILGQENYVDIKKTSWSKEISKWNQTLNYTIQCEVDLNKSRVSQSDEDNSNPYVENDISHNIGIYLWGSYQVVHY